MPYERLGWHYSEASEEIDDIAAGLGAVIDGSVRSEEALDSWVSGALDGLTPVEAESVIGALRDVGRALTSKPVRQAVGGALPVAGGIVGTVYGGPAGAAIGGSLGQAAGQLVGGNAGRPASGAPPPPRATAPTGPIGTQPARQSGSQAAGQLLYLFQDPAVMQSLLALLMGEQGKATVPVGARETPVPVGAVMNLIGMLAQRAAEDAEEIVLARHAGGPAYLRDEEGNYVCDPAVPDERAEALLRLMQDTDEHEYD